MAEILNPTPLALPYYQYVKLDGTSLFNAKIYVGIANTDPTNVSNQIDVLAIQAGGTTVSLTQPIRTNSAGLAVNEVGDVVYPVTLSNYSITVTDQNDALIYEESKVTIDSAEDEFNLNIVKLPIVTTPGQLEIVVADSPIAVNVIVPGAFQQQSFGAYTYTLGLITLDEPFPTGTEVEVQYGMLTSVTSLIVSGVVSFPTFALLKAASFDDDFTSATTQGYSSIGDGGHASYSITLPTHYIGTPDGFVDAFTADGKVAANIETNLTGTMGGIRSDGGDYSDNLQALANKLDPAKTLYIDSSDFSLSKFTLFNNGYKKVSHQSDSKVTWLGAGEDSTTTKAIYSINLDIDGIKTNETLTTLTTVEMTVAQSIVTVASVVGISQGSVIRVNQHVCRVESIDGLNIQTDRTLPIPSIAIGAEVATLDVPNIGSEFSGPSLLKFAPDALTQNYGFGVILTNCFSSKVNHFYGLHNSSKVCEMLYCADSEASYIQQYESADVEAGQGYALRISNGNDNIARNIQSSKGRHCVDITFSHRNKVFDCKDFDGIQASYLTHSNGCVDNEFWRCELHSCAFGILLGQDGGDFNNNFYDGLVSESRGAYRPVSHSGYYRTRFVNSIVASSRDCFVPRGNGESVFNAIDCTFDVINAFCNVDEDFTANIKGGDFKLNSQDDLFRGIDSGVPGAPTTDANIKINFFGVNLDIPVRLGRNNINADIVFDRCAIEYDVQPFGEDTGNQEYTNCEITDRVGGVYLLTMGSGNKCELIGCKLNNVSLPFRYFTGFPATGHVAFGNNALIGNSEYSILNNIDWTNAGYVEMTLPRSNSGNPDEKTNVHIVSLSPTLEPFKRYFLIGVWIDWTL